MDTGQPLNTIAFDADDTLWQNEQFFKVTQEKFAALLSGYTDADHLGDRLNAAERRNILHYGFGVKGFTLSMLETAIEVTGDKVPASILRQIIDAGRELLSHPLELLPGAEESLRILAVDYNMLLITKGDLFDQERKLAQSGLASYFDQIEIVSKKNTAIYEGIFANFDGGAQQAMMVGNSLKSDILPALQAGAWAVHVPHDLTWGFEIAEKPIESKQFFEIQELRQLPDILRELVS